MDAGKLLGRFDASIQDIAIKLRERMLEVIPEAVETVDSENIGLGFTAGYKGLVFVITPRKEYVMLGIAGGARLDDPAGLMEGKGKVHRHIKLYSLSELENPDLLELIESAVKAFRLK